MAALDTNVLLRFLLHDDRHQAAAASRLIRAALDAGQFLYVPVSVALELEWVLRSRFTMEKSQVVQTFFGLMQSVELRFEAMDALEWTLVQYEDGAADFADCMHVALANRAGEQPLWTFDNAAARLHGAARLT